MAEDENEPMRVLVAGGGVAALEAVLALRDLGGRHVAITLLAPESDFVYAPMSVREPFGGGAAARVPLRDVAADLQVEFVNEPLNWVAPSAHTAFCASGRELRYDALVLALGARREPVYDGALTFRSGEDTDAMHGLIQDLEGGYVRRIAFVVPPGITWPLPLYELALMTAERAYALGLEVDLTLITPEDAPLALFGPDASSAVHDVLDHAGVRVETSVSAQVTARSVRLAPSGAEQTVDRVVALPVLRGTAPRGIPSDSQGFIRVAGHGRVIGVEDVYSAGDGIVFPIKQGGIATQQADAVAEAIAKRAGAPVDPGSERRVLRGMLLTGRGRKFIRGRAAGPGAIEAEVSDEGLWWPPAKIAGRYLAPYLARRDGDLPATPASPPGEALEVEILLDSDELPVVKRHHANGGP